MTDLGTTRPDIAASWHPTKNLPLTPQTVARASNKKVWWVCLLGHEWETSVATRTSGAGCPFCAGKSAWPGYNDLATTNPDVAASWHPCKNGKLTPQHITRASERKVWWVCAVGHEWESLVGTRTSGAGCPVCSGWTVLVGYNDLATTCPDVAASWHPTMNEAFTPKQVTKGSMKSAWWLCVRGHDWKTTVSDRTKGSGCPFCTGRTVWIGFNDLATTNPEVAASWHPTKNGARTPEDVSNGSGLQIWWVCPLGHEWRTAVVQRKNNGRCPVCVGRRVLTGFNDLATTNPGVAASWHPTKNLPLTPQTVTRTSKKKVWWVCPLGHQWDAQVVHRTKGSGCHVCASHIVLIGFNDLATTNRSVGASWHPTRNGALTPQTVTGSSGKIVWWVCQLGHEWRAQVANRAKGGGCPSCGKYGFDQTSSAVLYFLLHPEWMARKIGITNTTGHRLAEFKRKGWIVLYETVSADGSFIFSIERAMLIWIRQEFQLPIYLGRKEMGNGSGWTETFGFEGPSNAEVITRIDEEMSRVSPNS